VIDHAGGIHALGMRVLGITAGQTRERLADLERGQLPTVEQARSFIREHQAGRGTGPQPMRDPHREEMAWQDALAKAAIDKEKIERRFVEPSRSGSDRAEYRKAFGSEHGQRMKGEEARTVGKEIAMPTALGKTAERAISKTLDALGNALESMLAPVLTPEQKRAGAQRQAERIADAAEKIDLSQYQTDRELARQRQEREQEAARQRQRGDRER
jgi:hypothetical protein